MGFSYEDLASCASFGVAGNFTGHLEQAGEDRDFTKIVTEEECAPKALFPTYLPSCGRAAKTPEFLNQFPFDHERIDFPHGEEKVQIEPECAVVCRAHWEGERLAGLVPVYFAASNDCSIRKEGARKISLKKNWGKCSKGLSSGFIPIDSFDEKGRLAGYRIASFLVRDGKTYAYGEDSAVRDYSYIWKKLIDWCVAKFNFQEDLGPAEDIHSYLVDSACPENIVISIGATRYTDFGEHNFLQDGDVAAVVLYPEEKYSAEEIAGLVEGQDFSADDVSVLYQKIIL